MSERMETFNFYYICRHIKMPLEANRKNMFSETENRKTGIPGS